MNTSAKNYRPNAAVIVTDGNGRVLLCERMQPSGLVQTVQGGIDKGETAEGAARRELEEELGINESDYEIIEQLLTTYRYDWTPRVQKKLAHTGFIGQEQHFFLAKVDPDTEFILDAHIQEFSRVWWGTPEELIERIWKNKRPGIVSAIEAFKKKNQL